MALRRLYTHLLEDECDRLGEMVEQLDFRPQTIELQSRPLGIPLERSDRGNQRGGTTCALDTRAWEISRWRDALSRLASRPRACAKTLDAAGLRGA
jgi:hypothetical protein